MKKIFLTILLNTLLSHYSFCQDEKLVTLTTIGQGKTLDEAKLSALRSAIEQAFGTFVSSNTQIINDELLKDDITSIANGNIHKYEIISQNQLIDNTWATTIKSVVSLSKIVSYCKSKGNEVTIDGASFIMNVKLAKLNASSEIKAIENLLTVFDKLLNNSFDYKIETGEPQITSDQNHFILNFSVSAYTNENYTKAIEYYETTINSIKMTEEEINNFNKINLETFPAPIPNNYNRNVYDNKINKLLRNENSAILLSNYFAKKLDYRSWKSNVINSLKYGKFKLKDGTNSTPLFRIIESYFEQNTAKSIVDRETWNTKGGYINLYKTNIKESGICICVWSGSKSYALSELEKLKSITVSPINE